MRKPVAAEQVAQLVQGSRKYADIDAALVATLSRSEGAKAATEKDAAKRVKRKLHQMVGAYLDAEVPFGTWLERLRTVPEGERAALCKELLGHHASTRERVAELRDIYDFIFAASAPQTVLDLACGLNPLGRVFMPLPAQTRYLATDVHRGLIGFLNEAFPLLGITGHAFVHDLLSGPPAMAADMVLLLKTLPCLEQADRACGRGLLSALQAPRVVVSFPTASLGGAKRGMQHFYQQRFLETLPAEWSVLQTQVFASELVLKLQRS
ncbi:MAG: 16S rRNA methyltransferase [Gammaproteobacteria bacterium]|nr:16S rRNA methyltransferase [Gammaproteobacteria bacterium]